MAQAFVDMQVMEVLGKTTSYANINLFVCEVLGKFPFGYVEVDLLVAEVLGKTTSSANIDLFVSEVIGQWAGF